MGKKKINNFEDIVLYDDVTVSDLFSETHVESANKRSTINALINQISLLVTDTASASVLGPILSTLLETSVKNDEILIKLAQVVQRFMTKIKSSNDEAVLSEEEKLELMNLFDNSTDDEKDSKVKKAEEKVKSLLISSQDE